MYKNGYLFYALLFDIVSQMMIRCALKLVGIFNVIIL